MPAIWCLYIVCIYLATLLNVNGNSLFALDSNQFDYTSSQTSLITIWIAMVVFIDAPTFHSQFSHGNLCKMQIHMKPIRPQSLNAIQFSSNDSIRLFVCTQLRCQIGVRHFLNKYPNWQTNVMFDFIGRSTKHFDGNGKLLYIYLCVKK